MSKPLDIWKLDERCSSCGLQSCEEITADKAASYICSLGKTKCCPSCGKSDSYKSMAFNETEISAMAKRIYDATFSQTDRQD
jgi:hypothetical protein